MNNIKTFKIFKKILESAADAIQLVTLIKDDGEQIKSEGYAEQNVGIFDYNGNKYAAGIDIQGNVHATQSDDNGNIFGLDGSTIIPNTKIK